MIDKNTHVHRQYKKPVKQKAAMLIRTANSENMARKASTMRLFDKVTNASLFCTVSDPRHQCVEIIVPRKEDTGGQC